MAWSKDDQDLAYGLTRPVQCGKSTYGTAFPIHVSQAEAWYVTCDHVLKSAKQATDVSVGDAKAIRILRGHELGLDLALVAVPVSPKGAITDAATALTLAPQLAPAGACRIPGCHRPDSAQSWLLREWVDATLTGERRDVFASASSSAMKGWGLAVSDDDLLQEGYSGAPVLSAQTGRVFAVAAFRSDLGKGGIAICISNLAPLLPSELAGLLPDPEAHALADELRALLLDPPAGFEREAAWAIVLRSAPQHTALGEMPHDTASFCDWLLNRCPWAAAPGTRPRDALFDLLLWLEEQADGDAGRVARIRRCRVLRQEQYPGLETGPLPEPATQDPAQPHLIEVVFDPVPDASQSGYAVHSHFHPGDGSGQRAGPVREHGDGGRLDPEHRGQVMALVQDLTSHRLALGLDAERCIFQFRVPLELLLHAVERWPKNVLKQPLGNEYPVVLAASDLERDWDACDGHWEGVRARLHQPLSKLTRCCAVAADRELTDAELNSIVGALAKKPCLVIEAPPAHPEPGRVTHLTVIAVIGVLGPLAASAGRRPRAMRAAHCEARQYTPAPAPLRPARSAPRRCDQRDCGQPGRTGTLLGRSPP